MRRLVIALFLLPAVINLLPLAGVLGADRLQALYGLPLAAAFRPSLRPAASAIGLVSMGSYLLLAPPLAEHNAPLQRVFWADVVAFISLLLALWLSRKNGRAS